MFTLWLQVEGETAIPDELKGTPGQIKIDDDGSIVGDGDSYLSTHLEIRSGIVTRFPKADPDYTNKDANTGHLGLVFRLPPPTTWDYTTADFTTDGTEYILYLADLVPYGAHAVLIHVQVQDGQAGSEIKFRNAE